MGFLDALAENPETGSQDRRRIAFVSHRADQVPDVEAAAGVFGRLGSDSVMLSDGDPALLDFDAIVACGQCGQLSGLRRLMRDCPPEKRPLVAAILREPLLPEDIPSLAQSIGMRLSSTGLGAKGSNKALRRLTRPVFTLLALLGMGRWSGVQTGKELQFAFEQGAWVRAGISEGWLRLTGPTTVQKCRVIEAWSGRWCLTPHSYLYEPWRWDGESGSRDIDVLFIGHLTNPRRSLLLARLVRRMREAGLKVEVVLGGLRGEARSRMLARTKIILHLPKYGWDTPWIRWYLGAGHGVALVSETVCLPEPFRPGVDYLEGPARRLPEIVAALAADEDRRLDLVRSCRARIEAEMDYAGSMTRFHQMLAAQGGEGAA